MLLSPESECVHRQVRLQSDETWSRWEVEVTPPTQSYMGRGTHKLASLFGLIFRRSSCQHPLLAGTLGRLPPWSIFACCQLGRLSVSKWGLVWFYMVGIPACGNLWHPHIAAAAS